MKVILTDGSETRASSPAELNSIVSTLDVSSSPILTVECHASQVRVGLSSAGWFIQVAPLSGEPPYFVTVGDPGAAGFATFFLHGVHHTEIPRRNLVPSEAARQVLSEFALNGSRSAMVSWEEV